MIIDAQNLTEVIPYNVRPRLDKKERWYKVPRDPRYAFSTFGQLAFRDERGRWKNIKKTYRHGGYAYLVKWGDSDTEEYIKLETLIKEVFFSEVENIWRIVPQTLFPSNMKWTSALFRWSYDVNHCHILFSKKEYIEYVKAKLKGELPKYPAAQFNHKFINLDETITIKKFYQDWHNMLERGCNERRKKARPDNEKNSVSHEWLHYETFAQWYLEHHYIYTGKHGNLELDKDIMNFGKTEIYDPMYCCFVPAAINCLIKKKCRDKKARAKMLRKIIAEERQRGEIPAYILDTLEQWAISDEMEASA